MGCYVPDWTDESLQGALFGCVERISAGSQVQFAGLEPASLLELENPTNNVGNRLAILGQVLGQVLSEDIADLVRVLLVKRHRQMRTDRALEAQIQHLDLRRLVHEPEPADVSIGELDAADRDPVPGHLDDDPIRCPQGGQVDHQGKHQHEEREQKVSRGHGINQERRSGQDHACIPGPPPPVSIALVDLPAEDDLLR